jgi:ferrous iron transport protein B
MVRKRKRKREREEGTKERRTSLPLPVGATGKGLVVDREGRRTEGKSRSDDGVPQRKGRGEGCKKDKGRNKREARKKGKGQRERRPGKEGKGPSKKGVVGPKLLLMGNPNVGKSVIFSRLTGVDVLASNYPGTTIGFTEGRTRIGETRARLIDVPGIYSIDPTNKAEEVAVRMLDDGDIIVNLVDATHLERNLFLTLQLMETGKPIVVALTMWDETAHKGITIDVGKLEEMLGVPVVPTVGLTGQGVKALVGRIKARMAEEGPDDEGPDKAPLTDEGKWTRIGEVIQAVQTLEHRHHKLSELIAEATIRPLTGIPIAIMVLALMFLSIIMLGNLIIDNLLDPLFQDHYGPFIVNGVESIVPAGWFRDFLIGQRIDGEIDLGQSFGILTTGVYVPLVMVLPFVVLFYLILGIAEDIGYLPRLAVLVDGVMHRIGLHGSSIISVMLGLGCNVPGILSTRILETRKQRFIQIVLLSVGVPCLAMTAMIFGILGRYGLRYIAVVFITLFVVYVLLGLALKRFVKGESPELLMEIPSYKVP